MTPQMLSAFVIVFGAILAAGCFATRRRISSLALPIHPAAKVLWGCVAITAISPVSVLGGPSLSIGFKSVESGTSIDLTQVGSVDWGEWGYPFNPRTDNPFVIPFNHKVVGKNPVNAISDIAKIGDFATNRATNGFMNFNWTDGTPTAKAAAAMTEALSRGDGNGSKFTVAVPKTGEGSGELRVYGDAFSDNGSLSIMRIVASLTTGGKTLSEQSVDMRTSPLGAVGIGYYDVVFKAPMGGDISISLTALETNSKSGISLQAATLSVSVPEPCSLILAATALATLALVPQVQRAVGIRVPPGSLSKRCPSARLW
jgi:hypothetical protein